MAGTPRDSTPRDRARVQTMRDIVRIGREHLAVHGAAGLSLRAVARDLGVVSSAVYRYVASRDELLTLLVVDGFDELGTAVDDALASVPSDDFLLRFLTIGRAVRAWGVREPATYALLFGSPVPGYEAPGERTTGPGTRVIRALARVWDDAYVAGRIALPDDDRGSRGAGRRLRGRPGGVRPQLARRADRTRSRGVGGSVRLRELRGVRPVRPGHVR